MDEMKSCFLVLIVLSVVFSVTGTINATITVIPSATVALINDSTFFNCSTTSEEVEWLFGSNQYPQPIIYSYGTVKTLYMNRFRVEKYANNTGKQFILVLQSVAKDDGGRYICRDPDRPNEEGKEVHLTVLETGPVCESNMNVDAPNSCGIKPETVQLSCSVRYTSNQFPELQWIKTNENIAINSSKCSDSGNTYTCNLTMESELEMEGSSYECQTTQSMTRQYKCTSGVLRIMCVGNPIVGIIVGVVAAVVIAICLIILFYMWIKERHNSQQNPPGGIQMPRTPEHPRENNILQNIKPEKKENDNRSVRGLTILNDKLFVVFERSEYIEIFTTDISSSYYVGLLEVDDLMKPGAIAACARNECLYIMGHSRSERRTKIFKVMSDGTVMKTWNTSDNDEGRISVNCDGNVVMTVRNIYALKMYSPDGIFLKENPIHFSGNPITYILHVISLADGNFILGHGIDSSTEHQVCNIDAKGNVLQSFGNEKGSGDAQLDCPAYVAERSDKSILVADQNNHRIILLSPELKFVKELFTKENDGVSYPDAMYVYEKTEPERLFVGCNTTSDSGGYVLVLRLGQ